MFFLSQLITEIWYFVSLLLLMIHSEWTHRKVSFTEQKVDYNIIYHKQERSGFFYPFYCLPSDSHLVGTA